MPESTMKVTEYTVTISELKDRRSGRKGQTVQVKDADPNELQLLIEKIPLSLKGKTKSMKCSLFPIYIYTYFGFGTKRHMVEPLAVHHVQIQADQAYGKSSLASLVVTNAYAMIQATQVVSQVYVFEHKGIWLNPYWRYICMDTGNPRLWCD